MYTPIIIGRDKLARIVALVTVKDVAADFVWKPVLFSLATLSLRNKLMRLYNKIYECNVKECIFSVIFHNHLRVVKNNLVTDNVRYSEVYRTIITNEWQREHR